MNPQQSTQWDGLRHHSQPAPAGSNVPNVFYGGTTADEILNGSTRIGVGHWAAQGIAGRGVLIDWVSYVEEKKKKKGEKAPDIDGMSRQMVPLDDVYTIAKECGIEFRKGDIFFLRVGVQKTWEAMTDEQRVAYSQAKSRVHAGLEQSERVVRFMWDNHFAAVASDSVSFEVFPPLQPEFDLHHHLLAGYGIPIGEMFDLEGLSELCRRLGRWTFFVSSSPLNCSTGVSSPPNCMAIF